MPNMHQGNLPSRETPSDEIIHDVGSSDSSLTYIRPRGKNRESKELKIASLKFVVEVSFDITIKMQNLVVCSLRINGQALFFYLLNRKLNIGKINTINSTQTIF